MFITLFIILNNLKEDPLETQHPKSENSRLGEIMADATSLTPPRPGFYVVQRQERETTGSEKTFLLC